MANSYCSLTTLKAQGTLNITGTSYDDQLLRIAQESSRMIDKYCDRYFYIYEGTKYYDGGATRVVLDDDVQSIATGTTGLTVDTDGDGVYESAYELVTAPVDAFLYPFNITPKTRLEANPWGQYGHFGAGIRKAIKITGVFGYGNDYPQPYTHANANVLTSAISTSTVVLPVNGISTDNMLEAGQTLQITNIAGATEQVFISVATASTSYTILRAQNGTSAISAGTSSSLAIYDYPASIVQAAVIQTIRSWKRRESGFVNTIVNLDIGNVQVFKGLDSDVKEIVNQYRRMRVPRYF